MGIVAMKTLKGARHQNLTAFRTDAASYAQAAFRWVLSNPDVSCLVVSFFEPAARRRVPLRIRRHARQTRPRRPRALRRPHRRHVLPSALRRLPRLLPGRARDQRRAALPHVLRGLRPREGSDAALRRARPQGGSLSRLPGPVRSAVPGRDPDPHAYARRGPVAASDLTTRLTSSRRSCGPTGRGGARAPAPPRATAGHREVDVPTDRSRPDPAPDVVAGQAHQHEARARARSRRAPRRTRARGRATASVRSEIVRRSRTRGGRRP